MASTGCGSEIITDFGVEEAHARWRVKGISFVPRQQGTGMESGPLVEVAGAKFGITAYWGGQPDKGTEGHYNLYARLVSSPANKPVVARADITVINQWGGAYNIKRRCKEVRTYLNPGHEWGWTDVGKFEDLLEPSRGLYKDDSVVMELHVKAASSQPHVRKLSGALGSAWSNEGQSSCSGRRRCMADDAAAFLASGEETDVELRGSLQQGEEGVRAHRTILAMRSPVFHRMLFASGWTESGTNSKINIEGADRAVVNKFVQFIYSDKLDDQTTASSDMLCHLLSLAHRYDVMSLIEYCSAEMTASLTEETAIERLMLAEQLSMPALKEQVVEYLCSSKSRLAQVQQTEPFARMIKNHPQLLAELFAQVVPPAEKKARVAETGSKGRGRARGRGRGSH